MTKMLHAKALVSKQLGDGVIEAVVGSSEIVDRMGEVILQDGWDLKNYKKNPVILWGHNVREERPPIGKALKVWLDGMKEKKLMFTVQFDLQDSFAAEIYRKVKDGFLNTVSVGFMPMEVDKNTYTKAELLELSFVPVPANPEAVVTLRGMGIEPMELKDMFPELKTKKAMDMEKMTMKVGLLDEQMSTMGDIVDTMEGLLDSLKGKDANSEMVDQIKSMVSHADEVGTICGDMMDMMMGKSFNEGVNKIKGLLSEISKSGRVLSAKNENKIQQAMGLLQEVLAELDNVDEEKSMTKGVIPFKDYGTAPEAEGWDGAGEVSKSDTTDLKEMCAWFDSANPDVKNSYKLPHHRQNDKKAVWRGVAAAMAVLLGARGGVDVPEADRKGIYNHLAKHYAQFDKQVPEFKMVEAQILKGLSEELLVLSLEREAKYEVRLLKKVLNEVKDKSQANQMIQALKVIDIALSKALNGSKTGGGK